MEKPVEIALDMENFEMAPYIMKNTENVFNDPSYAKKCHDFLADLISRKILHNSLIDNYLIVWIRFFDYRVDKNIDGEPNKLVELKQQVTSEFCSTVIDQSMNELSVSLMRMDS
jgi:hypothetical protein